MTFSAPKKVITPTPVITSKATGWRKNQPVKHQTFGIGIIKNVERKGEDTVYITAEFKLGVKKVDAKFLQAV